MQHAEIAPFSSDNGSKIQIPDKEPWAQNPDKDVLSICPVKPDLVSAVIIILPAHQCSLVIYRDNLLMQDGGFAIQQFRLRLCAIRIIRIIKEYEKIFIR